MGTSGLEDEMFGSDPIGPTQFLETVDLFCSLVTASPGTVGYVNAVNLSEDPAGLAPRNYSAPATWTGIGIEGFTDWNYSLFVVDADVTSFKLTLH
jgi:hypothetical protein